MASEAYCGGLDHISARPLAASVAPYALACDERWTQANIQHVENPRRGCHVVGRLKITTYLAQPAQPQRNRRSTGAPWLRQKWQYSSLLPVLAGAQTRRGPAQLQRTSRFTITDRHNARNDFSRRYVSHLNEMSRMSENLQRQKVAG